MFRLCASIVERLAWECLIHEHMLQQQQILFAILVVVVALSMPQDIDVNWRLPEVDIFGDLSMEIIFRSMCCSLFHTSYIVLTAHILKCSHIYICLYIYVHVSKFYICTYNSLTVMFACWLRLRLRLKLKLFSSVGSGFGQDL